MKVSLRKSLALAAIVSMLPVSSLVLAEEAAAPKENAASTATADSTKTALDPAQGTEWSKFASEIAKYGKAQQDPIALISAARILKESRVKEVAPDGAPGAAAAAKPQTASDAMKEWLDEARKIAQESTELKDKKVEIIALADEVGKKTRGYYTRHYYYRYHPTCY